MAALANNTPLFYIWENWGKRDDTIYRSSHSGGWIELGLTSLCVCFQSLCPQWTGSLTSGPLFSLIFRSFSAATLFFRGEILDRNGINRWLELGVQWIWKIGLWDVPSQFSHEQRWWRCVLRSGLYLLRSMWNLSPKWADNRYLI